MSTHKHINKICVATVILALLLTIIFMNGNALGIQAVSNETRYENRLFDTSAVHTIDIVMDNWDSFIETCENEEYEECAVVIDGESYKNVGIRAKGNTSLSTVSSMDSDRYSFKIEFDQYDKTKNYHGLDKLSLNNLIQDSTYMKDYLTYQMMNHFDVDAPLCSYAYITVNGKDWGLYLAVEGVEESFLQRNYGSNYGELYKPDSMSFGGGRGNGAGFDMDGLMDSEDNLPAEAPEDEDFSPEDSGDSDNSFPMPEGGSPPEIPEGDFSPEDSGDSETPSEETMPQDPFENAPDNDMNGIDGMDPMGSDDVKLQYIDDDPDSYSNIFDNAKTDITDADKTRFISSLKSLNENENIESVVNIDEVIRYFVVHNFVCNEDSYTGTMIHNYYLYEENGQLSMIPWDYNLAFGTFQANDATGTVNTPIDTPVSNGSTEDRPMLNWIFANEEYTELYHQYFREFLEDTDFTELIDTTKELIAPYVEKDPSAFYTYEEFESGVSTLREFCLLRKESICGQLDGTIPSTDSEQSIDNSTLIDASHLTLSDMGSMDNGAKPNDRMGNIETPLDSD